MGISCTQSVGYSPPHQIKLVEKRRIIEGAILGEGTLLQPELFFEVYPLSLFRLDEEALEVARLAKITVVQDIAPEINLMTGSRCNDIKKA